MGGGRHIRGVVRSAPKGTTYATVVALVGGGPHNPADVASAPHHQIDLDNADERT